MSFATCTAPVPVTTLIAYWLGELDGSRDEPPHDRENELARTREAETERSQEAEIEEHLFACEGCGARLREIVQLGEGIKRVTRAGGVHAVLTAEFIRRLQQSGMQVREYRLQPGGSVNCTVAPEDDLVIAHLDGGAAAAADQVVVMVLGTPAVDRLTGVGAQRVDHPGRGHRLQSPVNGRQADVLAAAAQFVMQLLGRAELVERRE